MAHQGKETVYYNSSVDLKDSNAALSHWKLSDGKYKVIFVDMRERQVGAEELIRLQAGMLQKKK